MRHASHLIRTQTCNLHKHGSRGSGKGCYLPKVTELTRDGRTVPTMPPAPVSWRPERAPSQESRPADVGEVSAFPTYPLVNGDSERWRALPKHTRLVSGRTGSSVSKSATLNNPISRIWQHFLSNVFAEILRSNSWWVVACRADGVFRSSCWWVLVSHCGNKICKIFLFYQLRNAAPCCLSGTFVGRYFSPNSSRG